MEVDQIEFREDSFFHENQLGHNWGVHKLAKTFKTGLKFTNLYGSIFRSQGGWRYRARGAGPNCNLVTELAKRLRNQSHGRWNTTECRILVNVRSHVENVHRSSTPRCDLHTQARVHPWSLSS